MKLLKAILNRLCIVAYGLDQLASGIIFLKPDHTVSGEVGYAEYCGKKWGVVAALIINAIIFWHRNHCYESIEWDEVDKKPFSLWKD